MRPALAALALLAVLTIARPIHACLWDSDTLAAEARGITDVVNAITGRFERNPPVYYELRIKRSAERIAGNPFDLEAYDDAAVACDRLRRTDEAITWMEKKGAVLDDLDGRKTTLPGTYDEMRYRYLANLGTFRVHRWARSGADRARIGEVQAARDLIAAAIALKPDAHFGREATQLKVLDALLKPPPVIDGFLPPLLKLNDPENQTDEAVRGLTGLIVLGDAWESVDLFNTLSLVLQKGSDRSSVALLARLRAEELIDLGRRSLLPGAPSDPVELKRLIKLSTRGVGESIGVSEGDEIRVRETFRTLRDAANRWQEARTAFMTPRLNAGRHPDTDPKFWDGYSDIPPPQLSQLSLMPRRSLGHRLLFTTRGQGVLAAGSLIASALVLRWARQRHRRRVASLAVDVPRGSDRVWVMREV